MGIMSDIESDGDRCKNCGRLLHEHYGGKHTRRTLRFVDDDLCDAVVVDITCANCNAVNEVFWQAWLPTTTNMVSLMAECEQTTLRRFAWAAV